MFRVFQCCASFSLFGLFTQEMLWNVSPYQLLWSMGTMGYIGVLLGVLDRKDPDQSNRTEERPTDFVRGYHCCGMAPPIQSQFHWEQRHFDKF